MKGFEPRPRQRPNGETPEHSHTSVVRRRLAVLALATAGTLWGVSFALGKLALAGLGQGHVTVLRFALANSILLPYALRHRIRPQTRDIRLFVLAGFLTVPATFFVQLAGLQRTSATNAALIVGMLPALIALAARILTGEQLDHVGWASVGLSIVGAALIVGRPAEGAHWLGDLLVFLSLLAVVGWTLLGKHLVAHYPATVATAYIFLFGTLLALPLALLWEGIPRLNLPWTTWIALLGLGLLCSAATNVLWNWGLRFIPAAQAGVFLNLEPLVGAGLVVAVLGDDLGPLALAGGTANIVAALLMSLHR